METPILKTKDLTLRPIKLDDALAIQKYFDNWNIIKNLTKEVPWPYPKDGAESFLKEKALPSMDKGEALIWAITFKQKPDDLIGIIHFNFKDDERGNRGFWIAEPFWKKGLMTQAIFAVQDYLFLELGLEHIKVTNSVDNIGSRRVKEKTGAEYIGLVPQETRSGQNKAEIWQVTRENWSKFRNI